MKVSSKGSIGVLEENNVFQLLDAEGKRVESTV